MNIRGKFFVHKERLAMLSRKEMGFPSKFEPQAKMTRANKENSQATRGSEDTVLPVQCLTRSRSHSRLPQTPQPFREHEPIFRAFLSAWPSSSSIVLPFCNGVNAGSLTKLIYVGSTSALSTNHDATLARSVSVLRRYTLHARQEHDDDNNDVAKAQKRRVNDTQKRLQLCFEFQFTRAADVVFESFIRAFIRWWAYLRRWRWQDSGIAITVGTTFATPHHRNAS